MMSPTICNNLVYKTVDNLEDDSFSPSAKDFKKNLPNKYVKLMHFGVWLISSANNISDINHISDNEVDAMFNKLCLYATVESQTNFYENFYVNEKAIAKSMRKFSSERSKELKKAEKEETTKPKGRDHILREAFIDSIIERFNRDRIQIYR